MANLAAVTCLVKSERSLQFYPERLNAPQWLDGRWAGISRRGENGRGDVGHGMVGGRSTPLMGKLDFVGCCQPGVLGQGGIGANTNHRYTTVIPWSHLYRLEACLYMGVGIPRGGWIKNPRTCQQWPWTGGGKGERQGWVCGWLHEFCRVSITHSVLI